MKQSSTLFNHANAKRFVVQSMKNSRLSRLTFLFAFAMTCFSINAKAQYCTTGIPSNTGYGDITEVSIANMTNSSGCNAAAPGTGSIASRYSNYYGASGVTVPLLANNSTYSFSIKGQDCSCNGCYWSYIYMWIDWNNDGDWTDAGELVYTSPQFIGYSSPTTQSGSFNTPATYSNPGLTRIRVTYSINTISNPCSASYSYGEVEEYAALLAGPCSGAPTAGTAVADQTTYTCTGTPTLDKSGGTFATGMQYQWQRRNVGSTTWTNQGAPIFNVPTYTLPTALTQSTQFRFWARCTTSNMTDTSAAVTVTVNSTTVLPADTAALCTPPGNQVLTVTTPPLPDTLFKEDFEGNTSGWTYNNNNSHGWSIKPSTYLWAWYGYNVSSGTTGNKFMFLEPTTCCWYSTTLTTAISPTFSTVGYTSATMTFRHWLYYYGIPPGPQQVSISIDGGSNWTALGSYTGGYGSSMNFAQQTISLAAYLNQPNCKLRFSEQYYYANAWAVDDIIITGAHAPVTYAWTATPSTGAGLPASAATPSLANTSITVNPSAGNYLYKATVTGQAGGCGTTDSVYLKVGPKPTATISGTTTICNGDQAQLTVNFAAAPAPYSITYTNGTTPVTINNITANPYTIAVSPSSTKTYTLTNVSSTICPADPSGMTGSPVVTVNPRPTSAMNNGSQVVCDAATAYLPVTFTGTPPFNITFTDGTNTYTQTGIAVTNYLLPVTTQTGTHTYTMVSLTDANGCMAQPADMTGSSTVVSQVRPTGHITGNPTLCNGSLATLSVSFTGTGPYSFGYSDGGSFIYSVNNITTNPYTLTIAPSATATYVLDHVTDVNCTTLSQDLSGSSFVTVHDRPTSLLSGVGQTICDGNQVNLSVSFTGIPPYTFGYSNGTSSSFVSGIYSSTYNFTVTPTVSGTYIVTGLNDLFCTAQLPDMTGAVPITVRNPNATISGTQVTCINDNTSLLVDFGGPGATAPYTFIYNNGVSNVMVSTSSDPYVLPITTLSSSTYSLVSMTDANCPGDISGSAMITVNPPGGWKGMISSDWQNPSNWCGVLPTATTDVLIPATAPNMPVLSYGAGYCDTMTVMPGASVTVSNNSNLNLHGDLYNSGILNWSNGYINFYGSVPQYVNGFTAKNVTVYNNPGVVFTSDAEVVSLLSLSGNVYLNNANLTIKSGGLVFGDAYNKYIHTQGTGVVKMDVSTGAVKFPVGNSTYNPVWLTNTGVPDQFSVRVVDAVYQDGYGVNPATVNFPVVNRTWMISEATQGGSVVLVTPQWNGMTGEEINDFDRGHAFIRHFTGGSWTYQDSANAGPGIGPDPYTISEFGYTTFSPFTVGGWSQTPLAIGLLDFTAQLQDNNNALLNWTISESSDAQKFEIEHSTDGTNFSRIGEVTAVDNKTGYNNIHRGLAEGRNYYRLLVTDKSGKTGYSKIAVVVTKGLGVEVISLSPNPVTGVGVVAVNSDNATKADVKVMDAVGRVMYTGTHDLTPGMNTISLDMNSLPQGNYTLHVMTDSGKSTPVKFTKL